MDTQYSKPTNTKNIKKKISDFKFKKSYVSPYSQKIINNNVKI